MEAVFIPNELDLKRWVKEALIEYFESNPLPDPSETNGEENFLNRKQVAGMLGISLVTLGIWMNEGLPCHKKNRRVFFLRSEVMEYVIDHKRKAVVGSKRGDFFQAIPHKKAV
jgi:hypothetical protein